MLFLNIVLIKEKHISAMFIRNIFWAANQLKDYVTPKTGVMMQKM